MSISIGKQVIQNIVGDLEYKIECTGGNGVSMSNYNGKVFINGIEAPTEEGTYKIKNIPGGILKIKRHKGKLFSTSRGSVVQNISGVTGKNVCIENHGVLNNYSNDKKSSESIRLDKDEHSEIQREFRDSRVIKGDYTVSGMNQTIKNMNIIVYGDVVVSGMNNKVIRGKENVNLPDRKSVV